MYVTLQCATCGIPGGPENIEINSPNNGILSLNPYHILWSPMQMYTTYYAVYNVSTIIMRTLSEGFMLLLVLC